MHTNITHYYYMTVIIIWCCSCKQHILVGSFLIFFFRIQHFTIELYGICHYLLSFRTILWTCNQHIKKTLQQVLQQLFTAMASNSKILSSSLALLLQCPALSHPSLQKEWLEKDYYAKVAKDCNKGLQWEEHYRSFAERRRREICPYRLHYIVVIWICTQLHINENNRRMLAVETA